MARYANYAWIIDKDHTDHLTDHEPRFNQAMKRFDHTVPTGFTTVDVKGPRDAHPKALEDLKAGKGTAFQLWDDDGIRYYSGRFFETLDDLGYEDVNKNRWSDDGPLGDYGMPNAGCTEMTIKNSESYIG
jgi:hypothetical protein